MQPDSTALPDYDALDALVDEDPIKLRDVAWQLRTRLAAIEAERDEAQRLRVEKADMLAAFNRLGDEIDLSEAISYMDVAEATLHAFRSLRAQTQECTCQSWPPDGPAADCPVHGAVRGLNQANARLAAYERLETAARALLRLKTGPRDEAYHHEKPWTWAELSDAVDALPAPEVTR